MTIPTPLPSPHEAIALALLSSGEKYGLELVKASNSKLKRGGVYVLLGRLATKGLVESRGEGSTPDYVGIPRRLYKITELGRRALRKFRAHDRVMKGEYAK
jgi:DNA-binding PadR family transcriptional regulator